MLLLFLIGHVKRFSHGEYAFKQRAIKGCFVDPNAEILHPFIPADYIIGATPVPMVDSTPPRECARTNDEIDRFVEMIGEQMTS